jgi:hypothetical protein
VEHDQGKTARIAGGLGGQDAPGSGGREAAQRPSSDRAAPVRRISRGFARAKDPRSALLVELPSAIYMPSSWMVFGWSDDG